jgi:hypothetical protein
MQGNGFNHKASDRLLKMPGKLDRGPVEFDSRVAPHMGEIMEIATTNVVSVPPTMAIIGAAQTMTACGFRRLPVTDPPPPEKPPPKPPEPLEGGARALPKPEERSPIPSADGPEPRSPVGLIQ